MATLSCSLSLTSVNFQQEPTKSLQIQPSLSNLNFLLAKPQSLSFGRRRALSETVSVATANSSSPAARRLYIGNIPRAVTNNQLQKIFEEHVNVISPSSFTFPMVIHRRQHIGYCDRLSLQRGRIKCMANSRRVKMVAKQIRRELSDMLLKDKVLQYAVLPEAALGADRYLSSLTTISDVEISSDLQVVKVYVSVFGDERGKEVALAGLKSKAKYVRSELGKRLKLRLTPEIRFLEDEAQERGSRVIAILDRLKEENARKGSRDDEDDDDLEDSRDGANDYSIRERDDFDDEGIIYVD